MKKWLLIVLFVTFLLGVCGSIVGYVYVTRSDQTHYTAALQETMVAEYKGSERERANRMVTVCEGVRDETSASMALIKLAGIQKDMRDRQEWIRLHASLSKLDRWLLKKWWETEMPPLLHRLETERERLKNAGYYGNTELERILTPAG